MSNYVVVLDPGHGSSEFLGGVNGLYIEKDIDLVVATTIKYYLEQFEGVTVYMTRESDVNVGLKERCDIAKAYKADYFFSIHFNMDAEHKLYGSEVFIPVQRNYYNKMYPFANELLSNYENAGFLNRGIKTRLSSNGKDNYYAVIKNCTNYGIPSCIVEHCYLDNINDIQHLSTPGTEAFNQALTNFGYMDALAIARTLKLKSTSLGLDFTNYQTVKGQATQSIIKNDQTSPEKVSINLVNKDVQNNTVTVNVSASDSNGYIVYYSYSTDGGVTYSPLYPWTRTSYNKSVPSMDIVINVPNNVPSNIVVAVYNSADLFSLSNVITVNSLSSLSDNVITTEEVNVENETIEFVNTDLFNIKTGKLNLDNGIDLISCVLTVVPLVLILLLLFKNKLYKLFKRK